MLLICFITPLRPLSRRLVHRQTLRELQSTAAYQRKILAAAVQLVKPGGTLVFSTCSINPGVLGRAVLGHAELGRAALGSAVRGHAVSRWAQAVPTLAGHMPGLRRSSSAPSCARQQPAPVPAAGENEANVRWLLDTYPFMRLVQQSPRLGQPGLTGGAGCCQLFVRHPNPQRHGTPAGLA